MTASIVEGLKLRGKADASAGERDPPVDEPSLKDAAIGNPIAHGQIIDLWKNLRDAGHKDYSLGMLLRGAQVYVPPPPPKPEPSDEYKALMARLRAEEEQRAYERMINPPPPVETFSQRFPSAGAAGLAHAFAEVNRPANAADLGDDDVTYNDVHRQLMLILNIVVSIVGVAATLWVLARWWSTPARLFLTMGGSMLVGVAEVALYSGYVWHLGEVKKKEKKFKEVKEVVQTWVVGHDEMGGGEKTVSLDGKSSSEEGENEVRRRIPEKNKASSD